MNYDQLHADGCLRGLPMRATLETTGGTNPSWYGPQWRLVSKWISMEEQPLLAGTRLRSIKLDEFDCCVLEGRAIAPGEGNPLDDDCRALVYLLNPADACVWKAIDSWVQHGSIASLANPGSGGSYSSVCARDLEVLELRSLEGEELESDLLAGAIQKLLKGGRLEAELAKQLGLDVPLYCTVVETPMLLKSLQTIDPEEWRQYMEHYWSKGLNEDIWS